MSDKLKIAIIGLDTSHAVAFPKLFQDPETAPELRIDSMVATRCMRFETAFQGKEGLDERQKYLESIGVEVVTDFDAAVADCDAIMIEINDPALHLEYFEKCAKLGKPLFLDKPFAANTAEARKIMEIAKANDVRFFTTSSLRYDVDFEAALEQNVSPQSAVVWGPVGKAPAGSSIVWYGVHAFEMLARIMGQGAESVSTVSDGKGYVCTVKYNDGRRGVVELTCDSPRFGAVIRDDKAQEVLARVSGKVPFYYCLMLKVEAFFRGTYDGVPLEESLEVMKMLEAAEMSSVSGKAVSLCDI